MSRHVRTIGAALCALLLASLVGPAPAQAAGEDWRLLYAGGDLRDGDGALKSEIPANISIDFPAARFSRDGTRLAAPGNSCGETCETGEGALRIYRPDGSSVMRGQIPDFFARSMAWSADGQTVAALGPVLTPGDNDIRIYLIPVDGSAPTQVYSDTRLLRISDFGGVSWNPVSDRLAFVATEFYDEDQGFARFENSDQVWTVPASLNATPSRWTGRPACEGCASFPGYREPTWSPDGSRLAVRSGVPPDEFGNPGESFVGYLPQGALAATPLRAARPEDQLAFSSDGEYLAYGVYDTSGDFYDETEVIDADTGALVEVVEGVIAPFTDWLPCPTGTCQVWQDVYVPPVPFMNLSGAARKGKVVASGEMGRVDEVETVRVTLDRRPRARAPWRKVATVEVRAVEGLFTKSFTRPRKAVQCRVRAVLVRDTRAADTAVFRC